MKAFAAALLLGAVLGLGTGSATAQQSIEVRLPAPLGERAAAALAESLGQAARLSLASQREALGRAALVFADRLTLEALSMEREAVALDGVAEGLDPTRLGPQGRYVLPWSLRYLVTGAAADQRALWTWDEFAAAAVGPRRLAVCRASADAGPWALCLADVQRTGRVHDAAAALVAALAGEVEGCQDWVEAMQLVRDGEAQLGVLPQPLADADARPFAPAAGMPIGLALFAADPAEVESGRAVARRLCDPVARRTLAQRLGLSEPAADDAQFQSGATGQFLRRFVDHLHEQSVGNGVATSLDWGFLGLLAAVFAFVAWRLLRARSG